MYSQKKTYIPEKGNGFILECANPECNKKIYVKRGVYEGNPYKLFTCSRACKNHPVVVQKRTDIFEKIHGFRNTFETPETKEKIKKTNIKKYGTENPFASPFIKKKIKKILIERYGVESPMQSDVFLQKAMETRIKKYGEENLTGVCPTEKTKKTNNERYGNDWFFGSKHGRMDLESLKKNYDWSDNDLEDLAKKRIKAMRFGLQASKIATEFFDHLVGFLDKRRKIFYGEEELALIGTNPSIICSYDFCYNKKIIEFNGDFWHANPKKYNANDLLPIRYGTSAKEIWKKDRKKIRLAKSNGYDVLTIWEKDVKEDYDNTMLQCVKFLRGEDEQK